MGVYLSEPVKDKVSSDDRSHLVSYGASSMQGWRTSQEDAHNCIIDYDHETAFFAVYDGHGGAEVAQYCSQHLPDFIKKVPQYKDGDIEKALENGFLAFDQTLIKPDTIAVLKEMAGITDASASEDENEAAALKEEADMPLEDLLARYQGAEKPTDKTKNYEVDKPRSPYLRAKTSHANGNEAPAPTEDGPALNGSSAPSDKTEASPEQQEEADKSAGPETSEAEKSAGTSSTSSSKEGECSADGVSNHVVMRRRVQLRDADLSSEDDEEEEDRRKLLVTSSNLRIRRKKAGRKKKHGKRRKKKLGIAQRRRKTEDEDDFRVDKEEDEEEDSEDEDDEGYDDDDVRGTSFVEQETPGRDSGCTAVVAVLRGSKLYVANAGDSRCVVSRKGVALEMSFDHKPEDEPERARIRNAGGEVTGDGRVNGGLNLSRAIGDHAYKDNPDLPPQEQMITALPDVRTLDITPGKDEFMVLACDGIWNSMTSQEVIDFVRARISRPDCKLSSICEELFDFCLAPNTLGDGSGCDNMTCIVVKFHHPSPGTKRASEAAAEEEQAAKRPRGAPET